MKFLSLLILLFIAACTPAQGGISFASQKIGWITYGTYAYSFTTPEGAYCVYVDGEGNGGLSCDFSQLKR